MGNPNPELVKKILDILSAYKSKISMYNKSNRFDFNKDCEDIFLKVLNILYNLSLKNMNNNKNNYPGIDLGDKENRICYQITSDNSLEKIRKTGEKFNKNLSHEYDNLNVLILGNKIKKQKKIENVNVIDLDDLGNEISQCNDVKKLGAIFSHLEKEFSSLSLFSDGDNNGRTSFFEESNIKREKNNAKGYCEWHGEEYVETNFNKFVSDISLFPTKTRELIYTASTKCKVEYTSFYDDIFFDINRLIGLYIGEKSEVITMIEEIYNCKKLDKYFDDEHPEIMKFKFYNSSNNECMLSAILDYCDEKEIDFKKIIVDLDFSLLD